MLDSIYPDPDHNPDPDPDPLQCPFGDVMQTSHVTYIDTSWPLILPCKDCFSSNSLNSKPISHTNIRDVYTYLNAFLIPNITFTNYDISFTDAKSDERNSLRLPEKPLNVIEQPNVLSSCSSIRSTCYLQ